MTASKITPKATKNLDIYGSPALEWQRVVDALDGIGDLAVADSGSRFWISTTRPGGGPHAAAVGIVWDGERFYLATGARTQKGRNLAHDPRCVVSIAAPGIDIVAEGEARIIRDEDALRRIARLYDDWGAAGAGRRLLARVQRPERGSAALGRLRDHPDDGVRGGDGRAARRNPLAALGSEAGAASWLGMGRPSGTIPR